MKVGSLFAGIGGFDLGLERAGMEIAWQVEIDPWCRKVLAKHWPDVPKFEDVCKVGSHNLEPVDVICGGFPCQDISHAGKKAGMEGHRSGLWSEYSRIIRELRPRYVIVENVAALLTRGIDVVLRDLAESGYDAEWDIISAQAVGAPHIRERVWIIAYPKFSVLGNPTRQGFLQDGCFAGNNGAEEPVADAVCVSMEGHGAAGVQESDIRQPDQSPERRLPTLREWGNWAVEPDVGRVAHGVPKRVDRLRGLGNAVVPQIVEWIGNRIMED